MTKPTELHDMSLDQLADAMAAGRASSREIVDAFLSRIAKADGKLHSFVAVYAEEARALADAADAQRAAGLPVGKLHGLPIAVKDLCDIEGRIGTAGSQAWVGREAAVTATAVSKLMQAGMIPLGKTHMVEFAFGTWGSNPIMGAPWNPWDLKTQRTPGGSSSGTGVAVGARLAPAGIGSDTGGSVRIPAAMNGIVGLKTTAGRISLHGCIYLSYSLDTLGPMTRTVEDAALLLQHMAGDDPHDPTTFIAPPLEDLTLALQRPSRGMRIAVIDERQLPDSTSPAMRRALAEAVLAFTDAGIAVETIALPDWFFTLAQRTSLIIASEAYQYHRGHIEDDSLKFGKPVRDRILGGKALGAADYVQAMRDRLTMQAELLTLLGDCDALLLPTCPHEAVPLADIDESVSPLATFTRAINFLTLCGLAMPAGFGADGLPLSVQIVGRPFDEAGVLRLGKAFEDATGWTGKRPELSALGL
jgi:aspartyl-tRNA(Asn)/glutamyl-tRNA(Gln) amidotransferase subunit A